MVSNFKYNMLKRDYIKLERDKEYIIDSLNNENKNIETNIQVLNDSIICLNDDIAKLLKKKNTTNTKAFTISQSFTESAILLRENLLCTEL